MINKEIDLSRVIFEFCQEGNTNGTTNETEELNIEIDSSSFIKNEGDHFIVLKTNTGWSFDTTKELLDLIDDCSTAVYSMFKN